MKFLFPASSKKYRVNVYDESRSEERWLLPFSKVVAPSRAPLPLELPPIPNASMRVLERVNGSWL
jgi:hypothetical protein